MSKVIDYEKYKGIFPDIQPKRILPGIYRGAVPRHLPEGIAPRDIVEIPYIGEAIYLTRGLFGKVVSVGTSPTLLVKEPHVCSCLILNSAKSYGYTTETTIYSGTVNTNGTSQSTPINVSGYELMHVHLIVTNITGGTSWDFYAQTYDSITGNWIDSQRIFSAINTVDTYYAYLGAFGVGSLFALRWAITGTGSISFSAIGILKKGTGGSAAGIANTIYLGDAGVTTVSGYPLLEGNEKSFVIERDVPLYAVVASGTLNCNVFYL